MLFPALAADPERTREFLGVLTGTVDPRRFFSPGNLARVLGARHARRRPRRGNARAGEGKPNSFRITGSLISGRRGSPAAAGRRYGWIRRPAR